MKKRVRRRLTITVLVLLIIMLGIAIFKQDNPTTYEYEEVIVSSGDTFWGYYQEGYYSNMCYDEALYTFKKDNDKQNYSLVEGETVILRKVVE